MLFKLFSSLVKIFTNFRLLFLQSSRHWLNIKHDQTSDKRSNRKNRENTKYGNSFFSRETPKMLHQQSQISQVDRNGVRSRSMKNYSINESLDSIDDNLLTSLCCWFPFHKRNNALWFL